jgi:hypothetical protein
MLCKNKLCKKGNFGKRLKFEPRTTSQVYCCYECLIEDRSTETYKKAIKQAVMKENKAKIKEWKETTKTHSNWLQELQKVFNQFIRLRDVEQCCISCKRPLINKYDAGHFLSVGAYPNLRFDEYNVHGQCVYCNQHKHGNISEYTCNLPERIGLEQFESLMNRRKLPLKITIEEIKEQIEYYKKKVNVLKIS